MIILLLLFALLCGWILTVLGTANKDYSLIIAGLIVGVILPFVTVVVSDNISGKPSAMDVYRDKTTLEITYKNGVPIDSVVVFKDKEK